MNNNAIIQYLLDVLNQDKPQKLSALKKITKKMKAKERKLKNKLTGAKTDQDRLALEAKLKVNRAHRKKGIQAMRRLMGKEK